MLTKLANQEIIKLVNSGFEIDISIVVGFRKFFYNLLYIFWIDPNHECMIINIRKINYLIGLLKLMCSFNK